jgi:hypothetical protein
MTNSNDKTETKDKTFWFQKIFKTEKEIKEAAKNYDSTPWYKSPGYGVIIIVLLHLLAAFLIAGLGIGDILAAAAVFLPLLYLVARGYRPFLALFLIYYTADTVYTVYKIGYIATPLILWWLVAVYFAILAFKIENARVELGRGKPAYVLDTIAAIAIFAVFVGTTLYLTSKANDTKEVMYWKGFIYRNTDGIADYCTGYDVDMSHYVNTFKEEYKSEIAYVNGEISDAGFNPDTIYQDIDVDKGKIDSLIKNHFDHLYKILISLLVIEQKGITPEEFKWSDEYYEIITKPGFCSFIDLNIGIIQNLDSDFGVFPVRIQMLNK